MTSPGTELAKALDHAQAGRLAEAEQICRRILAADSGNVPALHLLGVVALKAGNPQAAVEVLSRATTADPRHALARSRLGTALQAGGRLEEAIACYRLAIQLDPQLAEAHYNLGTALSDQGDSRQAAEQYRQALRIRPAYPAALANLGAYLQEQGDETAALEHYEALLRLEPLAADAHYNRALILLSRGNWQQAWPDYEWRTRIANFPLHPRPEPQWDGTALPDRTLLIHAEQGLGDSLHFVRYVPLIRGRFARVVLQVQDSLVPLLRESGYGDVCGFADPLPSIDVQTPLMSLPARMGTTPANVPVQMPYLKIDRSRVCRWRDLIPNSRAFRIGIAWQGSTTHVGDRSRSIPLKAFAPLAAIEQVQLISLQKFAGAEQLAEVPFPVSTLPDDWDERGAFLDTAALVEQLDLVITADTAIAHLAGAMARPVWVALGHRPDWRWLRSGATTPWYPTMRLFRQGSPGDWPGVFADICEALRERIAAAPPG